MPLLPGGRTLTSKNGALDLLTAAEYAFCCLSLLHGLLCYEICTSAIAVAHVSKA
jgi:hypothetical protein